MIVEDENKEKYISVKKGDRSIVYLNLNEGNPFEKYKQIFNLINSNDDTKPLLLGCGNLLCTIIYFSLEKNHSVDLKKFSEMFYYG